MLKNNFAYNITISIECSDFHDIITHLSVIRSQIKAYQKTLTDGEMPEGTEKVLDDNNCYGVHTVTIESR